MNKLMLGIFVATISLFLVGCASWCRDWACIWFGLKLVVVEDCYNENNAVVKTVDEYGTGMYVGADMQCNIENTTHSESSSVLSVWREFTCHNYP